MAETSVVGLHVRTVSGQSLGRVTGVVLDVQTYATMQLEVRSTRLPGVGQTHVISIRQVQQITPEEVIVDDTTVPQATPMLAAST